MIYVYALTDPQAQPVAELGLDDEPIRTMNRDGIAGIYSRHAENALAPTKQNLLRHEQVAEALMRHADLLPTRFGTTFATEEHLCGALEQHAEALRTGLQRVRQCVELGLRVLWQPDENTADNDFDTTAAPSGREYMMARVQQERQRRRQEERAERLAQMIQTPLISLAREHSGRVLATQALLLTASYLVERDQTDAFRRRVQSISAEHPELRLLCTGPWPPYNFAPVLPATEEHHA